MIEAAIGIHFGINWDQLLPILSIIFLIAAGVLAESDK